MRLRRVRISADLLVDMFVQGNNIHTKVIKGLPVGTQFVRLVSWPPSNQYVEFIVAHDSFDEAQRNEMIPIIEITMEKLFCDEK